MYEAKEVGKIDWTKLGFDHDVFVFQIYFKFGASGQGFGGYGLEHEDCYKVLKRILQAVGVEKWEDLKGKYAHVYREPKKSDIIIGIGPVLPTEGKIFYIKELYPEKVKKE